METTSSFCCKGLGLAITVFLRLPKACVVKPTAATELESKYSRDPQKHTSISILKGCPYLLGFHYKGAYMGYPSANFCLCDFLGPYIQASVFWKTPEPHPASPEPKPQTLNPKPYTPSPNTKFPNFKVCSSKGRGISATSQSQHFFKLKSKSNRCFLHEDPKAELQYSRI